MVVFFGAVELRPNYVHHAVTRLVDSLVGDDAFHPDNGDFTRGIVVFDYTFFESRADIARHA